MVQLEHVNFTVADAEATAQVLCDLFDWQVRWSGASIHGGRSVHVGTDAQYVALYTGVKPQSDAAPGHDRLGGMNHIGLVVDDLDAIEQRVKQAGFAPHAHADYEPGRRFYFDGPDGVEYEMVSYA